MCILYIVCGAWFFCVCDSVRVCVGVSMCDVSSSVFFLFGVSVMCV